MGCKLEFAFKLSNKSNITIDDKDSRLRKIGVVDGLLPIDSKAEMSGISSIEFDESVKVGKDNSIVFSLDTEKINNGELADKFRNGDLDDIVKIIANSKYLESLIINSQESSISALFDNKVAYNNINIQDDLNNNNLYVLPNITIDELKYSYGQNIENSNSITEKLIVVNDGQSIGNNKIQAITKVNVGGQDYLFIPKKMFNGKRFASYINLRDKINSLNGSKLDEMNKMFSDYIGIKNSDIKEYFNSALKNEGLSDDFITFCKANMYNNRYDNVEDNILFQTFIGISSNNNSGNITFESFTDKLNRINRGALIDYINEATNKEDISEDDKRKINSLVVDGKIFVDKSNYKILFNILSNKLDISKDLIKIIPNGKDGFRLKYEPYGLLLDKIKGLNVFNYNAYNIQNVESIGDLNVYGVKINKKKESKILYFISPNGSSFNLGSSRNLYNTKEDAVNAARKLSIRVDEVHPFSMIYHDGTEGPEGSKITIKTGRKLMSVKPGSVRNVRKKIKINDDNSMRVRNFNNLKTDYDSNKDTTSSSAVNEKITDFVIEYIYNKIGEEEQRDKLIAALNEEIKGSYDAWVYFVDSIHNKIIKSDDKNIMISDYISKDNPDLIELAKEAYNAEKEQFIVAKVDDKKITLIQPEKTSQKKEYKEGDVMSPIVETKLLLNNMISILENNFGVKYNKMTRSEFNKKTKQEIPDNVSAVTWDGEIYIISDSNRSKMSMEATLIHEYSHLFLAILKQNENYKTLYENIMSNGNELIERAYNEITRDDKNNPYKNFSIEDIQEEAFCLALEAYITKGNVSIGNENIYGLSNIVIDKTLDTVKAELEGLNGNLNPNVQDNVFNNFMLLMVNSTSDTDLDSSDNILKFDKNVYNKSRQREGKLRTLIEDKKIEKQC